MALKKNLL